MTVGRDGHAEMYDVLHAWTEQITRESVALRERELRLLIRKRPRWLPERVWRWAIGKLLVLEEREPPPALGRNVCRFCGQSDCDWPSDPLAHGMGPTG